MVAVVVLIINLVIYNTKGTVVLIAVVNALSGVQNADDNGYLVIPIGCFVLIALMPFLCGRCLAIGTTVSFTSKLEKAI